MGLANKKITIELCDFERLDIRDKELPAHPKQWVDSDPKDTLHFVILFFFFDFFFSRVSWWFIPKEGTGRSKGEIDSCQEVYGEAEEKTRKSDEDKRRKKNEE